MNEVELNAGGNGARKAIVRFELFRGILKGSAVAAISPIDGYRYQDEELSTIHMNEKNGERNNNVILYFTIAQRYC